MTYSENEPVEPQSAAVLRDAMWRIPAMAAVWLGIGLVMGMLLGRGTGPIALAAALTAGVVLTIPVGVVLAVVGGRWDESLIGGMLGLSFGWLAPTVLTVSDPRQVAALAMISGALIGATVLIAFYRMPRLVASQLGWLDRHGDRVGMPEAA